MREGDRGNKKNSLIYKMRFFYFEKNEEGIGGIFFLDKRAQK
jgi:hypothetical protein